MDGKRMPWGIDANNLRPGAKKTLNARKIHQFSIGTKNKNKFELEKQARATKLAQENAEAAAMFDSFSKSFEQKQVAPQTSFSSRKRQKKMSEMEKIMLESRNDASNKPRQKQLISSSSINEEASTNLCIRNVDSTVTESDLKQAFSTYGRVYSVKILHPRTEEERIRRNLIAFVCFFRRTDAEAALAAMDNTLLHRNYIGVTWGKAVKGNFSAPKVISTSPSSESTIQIVTPRSRKTLELIDKLSSFVATHGSAFENEILAREEKNSEYNFLRETNSSDGRYYRWKVFVTLKFPNESITRRIKMSEDGPVYIPPEEGKLESAASSCTNTSYRKLPTDNYEELCDILDTLNSENECIKAAMGFAISFADYAEDIVKLIVNSVNGDSTVSRQVAHLHLVSDILHNSSSPVNNASAYRSKLQDILPTMFSQLSRTYAKIDGRISARTMYEKVLRVLYVWESWSLFPPVFTIGLKVLFLNPVDNLKGGDEDTASSSSSSLSLDVLQRHCKKTGLLSVGSSATVLIAQLKLLNEELKSHVAKLKADNRDNFAEMEAAAKLLEEELVDLGICEASVVPDVADTVAAVEEDIDGKSMEEDEEDIDGVPMDDDDIDGVSMDDDDIDGVSMDDDIDGVPMDDDIDGEPMD